METPARESWKCVCGDSAGGADDEYWNLPFRRSLASLDAVIYDDGEFAGPDQGGYFSYIAAMDAARFELLADMRSHSGDSKLELTQRLDQVISLSLQTPRPRDKPDPGAMIRRNLAQMLRVLLVSGSPAGLEGLINEPAVPAVFHQP